MNVLMDKPTNAGSSKAEYLGAAEKARRDVSQGRRLGNLNVYVDETKLRYLVYLKYNYVKETYGNQYPADDRRGRDSLTKKGDDSKGSTDAVFR